MLSKRELHAKYLGDTNSPGFIMEAFGSYKDPENAELNYLHAAHGCVVQGWKDVHQTLERVGRNYAVTPGQRVKLIADIAKKRMESALTVADAARERGERQRMSIEDRIQSTVRPPTPHHDAITRELRGHLRELSEADRYDLLAGARGDDAVMLWYAVASAPACLSGVVELKRRDCRDNLLALRDPSLLTLEAGIGQGLALLGNASSRFAELVQDHVDFDTADELRALDESP